MKIIITESQLRELNEAYIDSSGKLKDLDISIFDEFPEEILKTLENCYGFLFQHNFDWNKKQDEFTIDGVYDGEGFNKWVERNNEIEFKKNFNKIISSVRKDMILLKRKRFAEEKLKKFEELIIPVFGKHITGEALSEFEAAAILFLGFNDDIETQKKRIEQAMIDAKNIIDSEGNIDYSKINKSTMFKDMISVDKFEGFVKKNPEYKKTYDIWKKLSDEYDDLLLMDTISFHIVSYEELRKLYYFLNKLKPSYLGS